MPDTATHVLLQERAAARELYALPEVDGYFDDQQHFQEIK
jgi:hypothetical protein